MLIGPIHGESEPLNNNNEKKKKGKRKKEKKEDNLQALTFLFPFSFFLSYLLPTMTTRTINIQVRKFNRHSYTKCYPGHDLLIWILSRLTLKPRTDLYVFIFGRNFQTGDSENPKLILHRSMRERGKA